MDAVTEEYDYYIVKPLLLIDEWQMLLTSNSYYFKILQTVRVPSQRQAIGIEVKFSF